jgi:hypothetical protein
MSWAALPATIRLWGVLVVVSWVAEPFLTGEAPSISGVAVGALLWVGVASGRRWVWAIALALYGLSLIGIVFVLARFPDATAQIPRSLLLLGSASLVVQLGLLLSARTRAHLRGGDPASGSAQGPVGPPQVDGPGWQTGDR